MILHDITLAHSAILSVLHEESFEEAWSEDSFRDLIAMPAVFGFLITIEDDPAGFILCQGDVVEAEIITIATRAQKRRCGIGAKLLSVACEKTNRMFLEVAEDNLSALSFYKGQHFREIAVRRNYYRRKTGNVHAIVMEKDLS